MIGKTISHYHILEKLGEGGMGVVYKAHDTRLDRDVALKFLPPHLDASDEDIARFEQEARAISTLNHPHIETIHDVDEINDQKYLVLEYIPGGTLKSKLKELKSDNKAFSIADVLEYGTQLAEALAHAHRHQIIHRDVKTENVLLTEEGKLKLTDFGLAKLRGTIHKTKTGSTLGTVAYMSPEQIRGEEVDQRSDIFSLGVVLYELLTCRLPFSGDYEAAVSYAIMNEDPAKISSLRSEVPVGLEKIIERCLEKDRNKRYEQVEDVLADLRSIRHENAGSIQLPLKRPRPWWMLGGVAIILILIGLFLFYPRSGSSPANQKSIAVLPFQNLSDSKEDEYFSDGITDDIIAQLSKISDLKVISRTSVMQYKGTSKNIRQIGKELDVGTVLEGSVRHTGNQVRIVAQLIDARNEGHLWADTYDKEINQIFAVQSDVAQKIANALQAKLAPGEQERIEKQQTENTEAYQLYLKGRFYWNKRTVPDLQKSIEYFNQAIKKDPHYALAYAGLADSYGILPLLEFSPKDYRTKAQQAAAHALELDSTLAEAYTVLGSLNHDQFNWKKAEDNFKRAIKLNPNYPSAHQWYNELLIDLGRYNEAMVEIQRAVELDPLSLSINFSLAWNLYIGRHYSQAEEQCNKGIEFDPNFPWSYYIRGLIAEAQGELEKANKDYHKLILLTHDDPTVLGEIGRCYARIGKKDDASRALHELLEYHKLGYKVSFSIAQVYYGLGDQESTFEWLERSFGDQEVLITDIISNPLWDNLRSDPRFAALLKQMGLEK